MRMEDKIEGETKPRSPRKLNEYKEQTMYT